MIVHLTGSSKQNAEDLPYLRKITTVISDNDGALSHDWLSTVSDESQEAVGRGDASNEVFDAIIRSDVVIIEVTSYRLSQGYQLAVSLQMKRPTLVLSRKPIAGHSLSDLKNRLLTIAEYNDEEDLDTIVTQFMRDNTISTKDLRFNMFIDRPIYNYLRSVSYESGKNKSEIIRELINREIKNKD